MGAALHAAPEEEKKRVRGLRWPARDTVDEQVPGVYADLCCELIQQGASLATIDLLIASVAAAAGAALLTGTRGTSNASRPEVITY